MPNNSVGVCLEMAFKHCFSVCTLKGQGMVLNLKENEIQMLVSVIYKRQNLLNLLLEKSKTMNSK